MVWRSFTISVLHLSPDGLRSHTEQPLWSDERVPVLPPDLLAGGLETDPRRTFFRLSTLLVGGSHPCPVQVGIGRSGLPGPSVTTPEPWRTSWYRSNRKTPVSCRFRDLLKAEKSKPLNTWLTRNHRRFYKEKETFPFGVRFRKLVKGGVSLYSLHQVSLRSGRGLAVVLTVFWDSTLS